MNRFAALLDRLAYERGRLGKLALLEAYFRETPDPDRGWALAAMTGFALVQERQAVAHPQSGGRAHRSDAACIFPTIMSAISPRRWRCYGSRAMRARMRSYR